MKKKTFTAVCLDLTAFLKSWRLDSELLKLTENILKNCQLRSYLFNNLILLGQISQDLEKRPYFWASQSVQCSTTVLVMNQNYDKNQLKHII